MFQKFKSEHINKEQLSEFKSRMILENSKRFLYLLCLVFLSQIIFLSLELSNLMAFDKTIFISRITIIVICLVFGGLIFVLRKIQKKRIVLLGIITSLIQFLSILVGAYFTAMMFNTGIYSFSSFLLVSFIVSLTCVRNPYYSGLFLVFLLVSLGVYINLYVIDLCDWLGEFLIASVFIIMIYIGNIFNYKRHLRLFIQEKEITEANLKLKEMSIIDDLTGIYNRRKIIEVIENYLENSVRYKSPFAVAIIDLDHFKTINDNYGHNVGDKVLKEFSRILKNQLRTTDILGRWGGEEFIVVANNTSENGMFVLIERLVALIQTHDFEDIQELTFSAGVTSFKNEKTYSEIVEKADYGLYLAKSMGRNQVQLYPSNSPKDVQ